MDACAITSDPTEENTFNAVERLGDEPGYDDSEFASKNCLNNVDGSAISSDPTQQDLHNEAAAEQSTVNLTTANNQLQSDNRRSVTASSDDNQTEFGNDASSVTSANASLSVASLDDALIASEGAISIPHISTDVTVLNSTFLV